MDELLKETKEMMKGHVPSSSVINLEKYVNAGLKSADFIDLLCKLTNHIEHMMGVKAEDSASSRALATYWKNGNTTGILLMVSKLLKSLGCHHKCLTEGPVKTRLNSKRARLLLVHFFVSKAKSFEADVIPVQVDTMDKLKEVIQSGEEFYVVNDEVLNSKLFQTFRAELDRDEAKSEQDLREDKKRGGTRNYNADDAVRKKKDLRKKDRVIGEDEMKLAEDMKTLKKKAQKISDWFFTVKANLLRMHETKNAQMKKILEILEKDKNTYNQMLKTIINVNQRQDKILSHAIKEIFEKEDKFDVVFEIFDLCEGRVGLGIEEVLKVKLKCLDDARQVIEKFPFETLKQMVEGWIKEFEELDTEFNRLDLQIEKVRLMVVEKFDTMTDSQSPHSLQGAAVENKKKGGKARNNQGKVDARNKKREDDMKVAEMEIEILKIQTKLKRLDLQIEKEKLRLEKKLFAKATANTQVTQGAVAASNAAVAVDVAADVGPGHVTKRSQECGSTPPESSGSQEEPTSADGATAVTGAKASVDKDARICWSCHAEEKLLKCRGCFIAWYCDMECQAADWSRHSKFCLKTQEKRKRNMRRNRRSSDKYVPSEVSEVD